MYKSEFLGANRVSSHHHSFPIQVTFVPSQPRRYPLARAVRDVYLNADPRQHVEDEMFRWQIRTLAVTEIRPNYIDCDICSFVPYSSLHHQVNRSGQQR